MAVKALNSRTLKDRITFQIAVDTVNAFGEKVPGWQNFCTTWAMVEPLSGRELAMYKSQGAQETHRITLRYQAGIVPTMRIILTDPTVAQISSPNNAYFGAYFGNIQNEAQTVDPSSIMQEFRILSITDKERRHYILEIMAVENLHP